MIGPDVNLASRIARLNKVLGEPLLMSQAFVDVLPGRSEPLGAHAVHGFEERADLPALPGLSGSAVQDRPTRPARSTVLAPYPAPERPSERRRFIGEVAGLRCLSSHGPLGCVRSQEAGCDPGDHGQTHCRVSRDIGDLSPPFLIPSTGKRVVPFKDLEAAGTIPAQLPRSDGCIQRFGS